MRFAAAALNGAVRVLNVLMILLACLILVPSVFGIRPYIVMSGSMEPEIRTGAVAFVDTGETEASVGDIITFETGDALVTHRVYALRDGYYQTKGDSNEQPDLELVSKEHVIGRYRYSIPVIGYILASLGKKGMTGLILWMVGLNALTILLPAPLSQKQSERSAHSCLKHRPSRSYSKRTDREALDDGILIMDQYDFERQQKEFQEEYLI